ncbi:MAG: DUF1415 domain-containing protein [Halioglobus sp.]|nr:DUF1415 domain-containing protein [Halioglobus sp.]
MTDSTERHVRLWLRNFVVALNLCPFAGPLLAASNLRIAVCEQDSTNDLRWMFLQELDLLQRSPEQDVATTLVVFPKALWDFEDYLQFVDEAQDLLVESGLESIVQLASFHPQYLFAGEGPETASHFSNRAPYPLIHLLRENMVSRALDGFADPEQIPNRNIETLSAIGVEELERRWQALFLP